MGYVLSSAASRFVLEAAPGPTEPADTTLCLHYGFVIGTVHRRAHFCGSLAGL